MSDANPGNGVCETAAGNGVCTLRAAIEETNALAGADTIILPPNTYLLTQVPELTITGNLTITGGGAATTIIDGNRSVRFLNSVLRIDPEALVNISGVTIRNGLTMSFGGGIVNLGTVTLTNSTVSDNWASREFGGGIYNFESGTVILTNSTISGNFARLGGGGIENAGGTVTLTNSTVSDNTSRSFGGGIGNSGTATLTNSTVSGNRAMGGGGGIRNHLGTLTLTNSTVSGNTAGISGSGILNDSGTTNLFNTTITNNGTGGAIRGGGGVVNGIGAIFNFQNTILAGNFILGSSIPTPSDCDGLSIQMVTTCWEVLTARLMVVGSRWPIPN